MLADANAVVGDLTTCSFHAILRFLFFKERVLFNDNADLNGRTIIQHSTISSEQTLSISQRVEKSGGRFIDCPVLGSTVPAAEGRLVVLVGAHSHRDFDEFKPLLSCFGVPHYLGDIGRASIVKLALNQLVLSHTAALALSLSIIEKSGIDTDLFMEIVRPSVVYSPYFDVKYKRMKERNYDDPHWIASLFLKDANLIISEAQRLGINPASIQGTAELARQATQRGLGDKDMAAIYEVVREEQSRSK